MKSIHPLSKVNAGLCADNGHRERPAGTGSRQAVIFLNNAEPVSLDPMFTRLTPRHLSIHETLFRLDNKAMSCRPWRSRSG